MCHMAREVEVCEECSRNCLVIHGEKHDNSRKIPTFFKIMFGKNISELLIVPPKFSRKFTSLVGKKSYIEDSMGQKWKVFLSEEEESLAFKEGWNKFYRGNGIEQGDLLVFHHVKDSHFIVTIYGRSGYEKVFHGRTGSRSVHGRTGSEKPIHGRSGYEKPVPAEWSHQNKKLKTTSDSTTKKYSSDSPFDERESPQKSGYFNDSFVPRSDTNSIPSQDDQSNVKKLLVVTENVPNSDVLKEPRILNDKETTLAKEDDLNKSSAVAENVPKTDFLMEPCFLTDEKTTSAKEDDREHLLDLSIFELPDLKPIIATQGDDNHLMDFPTSNMANNNVDVRDDHREHLFDMPSIKLSGVNSSSAMKGNENYLCELSTCKLTEKKVDANYIGEVEVQGNTCSEVLGALIKYQSGDASIDLAKKTGLNMPSIELPDVNSSCAKIGEGNLLSDLSILKLTDKKVDANNIGELQVQGNTCSQKLGTLNNYQPADASIDLGKQTRPDMPSVELPDRPDVNSSYTLKGDDNYLPNMSTSELTDKKVDANDIGELQIQENPCSEVLDTLDEGQPENASMDLAKTTRLSQANSVRPSKKTEAKPIESEFIPAPSVSPRVSMPLDSGMPLKTIKKIDTFEPSAASGHSHLPGDKMRVVKQEPKKFRQDLLDMIVDDPPYGVKSDDPMEDAVRPIVKTEPVDVCDSDSASTIRIKCSIPDSDPFLVLPESLPLKRGHNVRVRQKLIFLRNSAGKVWPVIYFTYYKILASGWNEFRKANNICSGDECAFVIDSLDKGFYRVETSRS